MIPLFTVAWAFLKGIPWRAWIGLIAFALGVAVVMAYGNYRENKGASRVQGFWDAATTAQINEDRKAGAQQAKATLITVTEYVDRVQTIRVKGDTIIQKVPVYVPIDSADLPGGFRLLHDAAATNTLPSPPGSVEAEPVPAQDAATAVIANYTACHAEQAKLQSLWDWANRQAEVGTP